ncbi:MAG: hypothetical protein IKN59_07815 [Paludibacteraceae bacterium]|nr:hypothetical protein [Paludibacteraceae bacterium]
MGNKKHDAIINMVQDGDQITTKVEGKKMALFTMLNFAMEKIEGFADVVIAAGDTYKQYLAKLQKKQSKKKNG